jgi:c-di-GMP-related signal transduction protein
MSSIVLIICEVNRAECDLKKLEALINQDVSLPYKLINYLLAEFVGNC